MYQRENCHFRWGFSFNGKLEMIDIQEETWEVVMGLDNGTVQVEVL